MSKKVFRLYKGAGDGEDWFDTPAYGKNQIEGILDSEGNVKQITSIPSPFARLDLVLSAFRHVVDNCADDKKGLEYLDGNTEYHRLVSDSFDVATLFLQKNALSKKHTIEVVTWDKERDVNALLESSDPKHIRLGKTLRLYLQEDGSALNIDRQQKFFLLKLDHKVVGSVSPATMFVTPGNDLSWVNISIGGDTLFDDGLRSLYRRADNFPDLIKFYASFFAAYPDLHASVDDGPENPLAVINSYVNLTLFKLESYNHELWNDIKATTANQQKLRESYEKMSTLDTGIEGQDIKILEHAIHVPEVEKDALEKSSDFIIQSKRSPISPRPMVLQSNFNNTSLHYVGSEPWNPDWKVEQPSETDLKSRFLPEQTVQYPYLTAWDFFEDHIIKLVYPLNDQKYFNGNIQKAKTNGPYDFLIPLKSSFFQYFSPEELYDKKVKGKPIFEMVETPGGVTAKLRVPIKKDSYISLERIYLNPTSGGIASINQKANQGAVVELEIGLSICPFYRLPNEEVKDDNGLMVDTKDPNYFNVLLVDGIINPSIKNLSPSLSFFTKEGKRVGLPEYAKRDFLKKSATDSGALMYLVEERFSAVEISVGSYKGLVVPKFGSDRAGSKAFTFAIDFGTTYTHIEQVVDGSTNPVPFEITDSDVQYESLHRPGERTVLAADVSDYPDVILYPRKLGARQKHGFPQRSILLRKKSLGSDNLLPLADLNIPYPYGSDRLNKFGDVIEGVKWDSEDNVNLFLKNLLLKMRNKVVLNDGAISATTIKWFYPTSMSSGRRSSLKRSLLKGVAEYLPGATVAEPLPESIAPAIYYQEKKGIRSGIRPVVGIDIGGGTVDMVILGSEGDPKHITSARIGGNYIMGDGYNSKGLGSSNGFVYRYLPFVKKKLADNGMSEILGALEEIENRDRANEIVSFFFSLAGDKQLKSSNVSIDLSEELMRDEELRVVFLFYFGFQFYYLAKWMKGLGYTTAPSSIVFSGNGSKMANIIDQEPDHKNLGELMARIFSKVHDTEEVPEVSIQIVKDPKVVTAKGGLLFDKTVKVEDVLSVYLGDAESTITSETYESLSKGNPRRTEITDEVLKEAQTALELICSIDKEFNFVNNFTVKGDCVGTARKAMEQRLTDSFEAGLALATEDFVGNESDKIQETLFFYPFVMGLNEYASNIVKK